MPNEYVVKMGMTYVDATPEEFKAFIDAYPRPLTRSISGIYEPPLATFNDFTLGDYPESVVAMYRTCGGDPENIYANVPSGHQIAKEVEL